MVTCLKRNSSVPLRREFQTTMRPEAATAGLGLPQQTQGASANQAWTQGANGGTLGPCFEAPLQLRRLCVQRGKWFGANQDGARPGARIQSGPSNAAKGGAPPPPTIMAIASALPRLLMAAAAPAMTWLPPNVVIVDNNRGDSPSSHRARALRAGAQVVSRDTA
jgi:hypothetical protein